MKVFDQIRGTAEASQRARLARMEAIRTGKHIPHTIPGPLRVIGLLLSIYFLLGSIYVGLIKLGIIEQAQAERLAEQLHLPQIFALLVLFVGLPLIVVGVSMEAGHNAGLEGSLASRVGYTLKKTLLMIILPGIVITALLFGITDIVYNRQNPGKHLWDYRERCVGSYCPDAADGGK